MKRPAVTLALCLAAAFTTLLDQSSLNTAVPALRASLEAGESSVQWIIAGYSLTFGLALVPSGRLGDAHGRKWLFVAGITLFSGAAVVAGTAQEAWVVAAARLLQGVGAGTVNPQVLGIIQETFAGRDRTRALGAYAIVGGIAGVIGPIVGGSLIGALGSIVVLHAVDEHWLGVGLAVTQFASGAASGLIISPNQALTLMHAPPHSAGLAAAFLQLAQRVSATIGTAAVAGVVLGGAGLGPISSGLGICAAMLAAAVVVSARDLARDSLTSSLNIYTR